MDFKENILNGDLRKLEKAFEEKLRNILKRKNTNSR